MYIVLLNYNVPLEEIDNARPAHVEWLAKHYEARHFLVSGARNPRIGGVIIARSMPRGNLDAILATDPFSVKHLATYEVIEFSATRTSPELLAINEAVPH